ncbi:MAG TPA: acetyl-CoA carboxylase biotin carboxylase subunit [Solirubrobacteraceae bacterium]|nr:acetyl-CoA carboxylase biotin carboxylase subunit [Solirubrobacteraceae bacterium]
MFSKVLVANRGEIAVRVIRALDELGIASVAVYSEADRDAQHVQRASEAYLLGPGPAAQSYLVVEKLLEVIEQSGAEAVHPGYGFLAENAGFARRLEEAGVTFIGPPASAIEAMGSKTRARELMQKAGVPIVPGVTEPVPDVQAAAKIAKDIGYPVAVKAAGGGGGKGFRVALSPDKLEEAFEGAAREGEKFFSDATVYLERYLPDPRHVEVQVLADGHGSVIHLGERDCSIQRRHQKLIEESPAPLVDEALRDRIGRIATEAARAVDYRGAGTIEGLLQDGEYFFLEMNTRVQVEHCVTEATTGIDIVREQIRIAAGEPLSVTQDQVVLRGHAIECRINAEDAAKNFAPAPGTVTRYREPSGPGVRVDSGVLAGSEITPLYDPMVAKLIVWDSDRESATRRMARALEEFDVDGVRTLIPFHKAIMASEQWARAETCRDLIEDRDWLKTLAFPKQPTPGGDDEPEPLERSYVVEVSGKRFDVKVLGDAIAAPAGAMADGAAPAPRPKRERRASGGGGGGGDTLASPLQGNVFKVLVEQGATVEEGALVCIIEAMKMENEITAHKAGVVAELPISEGAAVSAGDTLAVIKSDG